MLQPRYRRGVAGPGELPTPTDLLLLATALLSDPAGDPLPTLAPSPPPDAPDIPPGVPLPPPDPVGPRCHLMSGFALLVQLLLACCALSALVYKRHREHPRRPWAVWALDTGKQVAGQTLMHTSNLLLSFAMGRASEDHGNPCVWYFCNFMLDTTLGVGIVWLYLRALTAALVALGVTDLATGNYGHGPRPDMYIWFKQLLVFTAVLMGMKGTVVFLMAAMPIWAEIGAWFLSWVPGERGQVVLVMFIVPIIMNVVQFWLVDTVIKDKSPVDDAPAPPAAADYLPFSPSPGGEGGAYYASKVSGEGHPPEEEDEGDEEEGRPRKGFPFPSSVRASGELERGEGAVQAEAAVR
ncbi:vacuolar membrane protein-domain-containing protein [Hyaloraphidium curvatum]|nr:vacuolar membrane protein-domain-containing protein [Hyaloraphidium curvatum]